jgi:hypothetical protein
LETGKPKGHAGKILICKIGIYDRWDSADIAPIFGGYDTSAISQPIKTYEMYGEWGHSDGNLDPEGVGFSTRKVLKIQFVWP